MGTMNKVYLAASTIPIAKGQGKICTYINRYGHFKTFGCGDYETCCREECCGPSSEFYTLWYFWLASFLLLGLVAGLSYIAWRRWLRQQSNVDYSSTVENRRIIDFEEPKHHMDVNPVSPPPYKCSPPSYTSEDSMCLPPPPYHEKDINTS